MRHLRTIYPFSKIYWFYKNRAMDQIPLVFQTIMQKYINHLDHELIFNA